MNFFVNHLANENVVEIVTSGHIDHEKRKEIIRTAWAASSINNCSKVLINKKDSERIFDQQMVGALKIIRLMKDLTLFHETRIAVLNKSIVQYDEFFEEMALLKGLSLKNFINREVALQWLCRPY